MCPSHSSPTDSSLNNAPSSDAVTIQAPLQPALRKFKAEVFQALGHPTRVHIIECLRSGELSVRQLLDMIDVEPANLSQHLSVLRGKQLIQKRKMGSQVFYTLRDPMLINALDTMRQYFQAHLEDALFLLKAIENE